MTLTQIKYVEMIAKYGSFSEASRQLFVSQPAISTAIRDLEQELNISIFIREQKGIRLTDEGAKLLRYASQMLEQERAIYEEFKISEENVSVQFGVSSQHFPFVAYCMTELIREFGEHDYNIHINETSTLEVLNDVVRDKAELGIIAMNSTNERPLKRILKERGLETRILRKSRASVFLARDHPLADRKELTLADMEPYPFFSYDQGDDVQYYLAEEIIRPEHHPGKIITVNDEMSTLYLFLKLHAYTIGTGITAASFDVTENSPILSVPLKDWPDTKLCLLRRKGEPSMLAARYVELLEEFLSKV